MSETRLDQPNRPKDPLSVVFGNKLRIDTEQGGFVFVCAVSLAIVVLAFSAMPLGMKLYDKANGLMMSLW